MLKIKIKKLRENFELPKKAFESDACYDVKACHIEQNDYRVIIYFGFATEIKLGWKGIIVPRSSFTSKDWVMLNSPGQVDSEYRGEWQMRLRYIGDQTHDLKPPFEIGDKVAQIYFESVWQTELELVDELKESERSAGGFGHTGK